LLVSPLWLLPLLPPCWLFDAMIVLLEVGESAFALPLPDQRLETPDREEVNPW
jgi:hypothetical protein